MLPWSTMGSRSLSWFFLLLFLSSPSSVSFLFSFLFYGSWFMLSLLGTLMFSMAAQCVHSVYFLLISDVYYNRIWFLKVVILYDLSSIALSGCHCVNMQLCAWGCLFWKHFFLLLKTLIIKLFFFFCFVFILDLQFITWWPCRPAPYDTVCSHVGCLEMVGDTLAVR